MDIITSKEILGLVSKIESELDRCQMPIPNEDIPRKIERLASKLSSVDTYASEKAYQIASYSKMYYSVRKHDKYPGGATELWHFIRVDLPHRIRRQAAVREKHGSIT